ncbi:MAG: DUF169 domain-containing protein [Dehalococcoidia bacterium]
MSDLSVYRAYGEELERHLRLKTFPLAVKMLENEGDIPSGARRPLKDLGYHLSMCQSYQVSRREGTPMAMLKEDMWCFEPVVGYGLGEPPEYFLEGNNRFPRDVRTLEAGSHYAEEFPRLNVGKYIGVVSAPLKETTFEPDLVMIYCDPTQLSLLLLGRECKDGYNLKCSLSSHADCVYAVVPALQSGECQIAIPCRGDHYRAMAGDDEMIFTAPKGKLADLMEGLKYVESTGSKLPRGYGLLPEHPLAESYEKIGKMMGYM